MTDNLDLNFDLIDIDDDTLVNDDFYDESMSIIEEEKPKSSYLTEEELMILPFDMSKDFFVLRPKKNNADIQKNKLYD